MIDRRAGRFASPSTKAGFTLIEMVVVLAIIALILLLAGGTFDGLIPEYALRAEARAIGQHMKTAKGEALATGRDVYIGYDLRRGRYWMWLWEGISEDERLTQGPTGRWSLMFEKQLKEGVRFSNVIYGRQKTVTYDVAPVRVTPMGTADHHIVNLVGDGGQELAVKLNGVTGVVSYHKTHLRQRRARRDE